MKDASWRALTLYKLFKALWIVSNTKDRTKQSKENLRKRLLILSDGKIKYSLHEIRTAYNKKGRVRKRLLETKNIIVIKNLEDRVD